MSRPVRTPSEVDTNAASTSTKRPYAAPRVLWNERLEGFASVCSPGKVSVGTCPEGPISS
ncbi:MAG: hypothetical protein U0169_25515 [Polyangiaceae bacterium]